MAIFRLTAASAAEGSPTCCYALVPAVIASSRWANSRWTKNRWPKQPHEENTAAEDQAEADASETSNDEPTKVMDYQIESQRGLFVLGVPIFSASWLLPCDPAAFSTLQGAAVGGDLKHFQPPNPGWEWAWPNWCVDMRGQVDYHGWSYNIAFVKSHWTDGSVKIKCFVRQRRWKRLRQRIADPADDDKPELFDAFDLFAHCRNDREKLEALVAHISPETVDAMIAHKTEILQTFKFPDTLEKLPKKLTTPAGIKFLEA